MTVETTAPPAPVHFEPSPQGPRYHRAVCHVPGYGDVVLRLRMPTYTRAILLAELLRTSAEADQSVVIAVLGYVVGHVADEAHQQDPDPMLPGFARLPAVPMVKRTTKAADVLDAGDAVFDALQDQGVTFAHLQPIVGWLTDRITAEMGLVSDAEDAAGN